MLSKKYISLSQIAFYLLIMKYKLLIIWFSYLHAQLWDLIISACKISLGCYSKIYIINIIILLE